MILISKKSKNFALKNLTVTENLLQQYQQKHEPYVQTLGGKKHEKIIYIYHCTSHHFLKICPLISSLHITSDISNH